ncbi:hypothetical protein ACJJTC_018767 [Scirpophaga incertulas]
MIMMNGGDDYVLPRSLSSIGDRNSLERTSPEAETGILTPSAERSGSSWPGIDMGDLGHHSTCVRCGHQVPAILSAKFQHLDLPKWRPFDPSLKPYATCPPRQVS